MVTIFGTEVPDYYHGVSLATRHSASSIAREQIEKNKKNLREVRFVLDPNLTAYYHAFVVIGSFQTPSTQDYHLIGQGRKDSIDQILAPHFTTKEKLPVDIRIIQSQLGKIEYKVYIKGEHDLTKRS